MPSCSQAGRWGAGAPRVWGQPLLADPSPRAHSSTLLSRESRPQQCTESQTDTLGPSAPLRAGAPRGHARPRTSPQPHAGLQRLAAGQSGGGGAGRRRAGRFTLAHPPPLSLSSCPGSVSQRREQNVYKPLPLFEAHFRSTRELLPKQSNHSTFNKTKQTSQRY